TDTELPPRPSLGAALATLADSPTAASQAVSYLLALPHSDPSQLQDFCTYLPSELFSVELAEVVAAVNDADVNRALAYRAAASAAVTDPGQRFLSSRRHEVPRLLPPDTAAVVLEAFSKDRRRSTGDALATYLPLLLPFLAVRLSSVSDSNLNPSSLD